MELCVKMGGGENASEKKVHVWRFISEETLNAEGDSEGNSHSFPTFLFDPDYTGYSLMPIAATLLPSEITLHVAFSN